MDMTLNLQIVIFCLALMKEVYKEYLSCIPLMMPCIMYCCFQEVMMVGMQISLLQNLEQEKEYHKCNFILTGCRLEMVIGYKVLADCISNTLSINMLKLSKIV